MKPSTTIRIDDTAGTRAAIFADRATIVSANPRCSHVTHDFAALVFYMNGSSRIEQRAVWTLEPGDVLIVPSGEPHRLIEARRTDFWRLGFCVPCLAADTSADLLAAFERVRDGASPVVRIAGDRCPFLESLFKELSAESATAPYDHSVRRSLLTLILHEVTRAAAWSTGGTSPRTVVAETLRYIERHCLEPLTLTQVAAAMKRTPSYVTTALTRATGRSAVAWIIAGRMAEARRRLLHSDETIEAIAERVGYADVTHFVRLFRRTHGATPAAWRAERSSRPPTPRSRSRRAPR